MKESCEREREGERRPRRRRIQKIVFCSGLVVRRTSSRLFLLPFLFSSSPAGSASPFRTPCHKKRMYCKIWRKTERIESEATRTQFVVEEEDAAASAAVSSAPPVCVPASFLSFSLTPASAPGLPPPTAPLHLGPAARESNADASLERGAVSCCCCCCC